MTDRADFVMIAINKAIAEYEELEERGLLIDSYKGKEWVGKFGVLRDGMSGNYYLAGKVIAFADEYDGLDLTVIHAARLQSEVEEVRTWLKNECSITDEEPALIIGTHWH